MPADITGVTLLTGAREFTFRPGRSSPICARGRDQPRSRETQAALLEAMQERTVTVDGTGYPLSATFTVFATQNPVESRAPILCLSRAGSLHDEGARGLPRRGSGAGDPGPHRGGIRGGSTATYGVTRVTDAAGLERLRAAAEAVRVESQIAAYITESSAPRGGGFAHAGASPRAGCPS